MSFGTINKVIWQGRLAADPEVRYLPSGVAVANMRVATTESRKNKETNEREDHTEWLNISLFDKRAETAGQILKKGYLVYFEGKLQTRRVPAKDGGKDMFFTEMRADEFQIVIGEKREANGEAPARAPAPARAAAPAAGRAPAAAPAGDGMDDDIPF